MGSATSGPNATIKTTGCVDKPPEGGGRHPSGTCLAYVRYTLSRRWHTVGYATTNECYKRTNATTNSFFSKIGMLQRTQMLQGTRRNTIGRRSMRVRMKCRAFPLWLERQSSSLLSFVRFGYQFSLVICLFAPLAASNKFILYYFYTFFKICITFFLFNLLAPELFF